MIKKPTKKKVESKNAKFIVSLIVAAIALSIVAVRVGGRVLNMLIVLSVVLVVIAVYIYTKAKYAESSRIKKMEAAFPDFLQLMSSNLRAGMTTDNALLLSSRKEFYPLDREIARLGRDIITGEHIDQSLIRMSQRINSEKIEKTINLIVSGLRSGGDMATLLEETAASMRERNFVEKKAASNVLMYVIFIFFAAAVGGPALFALSSVLVEILTNILSSIPPIDASATARLPFTLTAVSISPEFVKYFALAFMVVTNILGTRVIGMVSKGDEKSGVKFLIPILAISFIVFFGIRFLLTNFFSGFFG